MRFPRSKRLLAGGVIFVVVAAGAAVAIVAATSGSPAPHNSAKPPNAPRPSSTGTVSPSSSTPGGHSSGEPHVMVILMENHGYAQLVGSPTAPYLNMLASRYGLATESYATAHPSLPNYLALVSGSTQGVVDDCTTCTANAPQLVDQLQDAGIPWRAFMEGAPSSCFSGTAPPFDRHHDPFVYAPHIVDDPAECDRVVPFTTFGTSLVQGRLPAFVWVSPDVEHDMHTGSVAAGDAWLRRTLTPVLDSAWYRADGTVIITFDEATGGTDSGCCTGAAGGHVMTVVVSPHTPRGARLSRPIDDAGILRSIESLYRLPFLGAAANPKSGTLLPLLGSS